jgi:hypothetical protein
MKRAKNKDVRLLGSLEGGGAISLSCGRRLALAVRQDSTLYTGHASSQGGASTLALGGGAW